MILAIEGLDYYKKIHQFDRFMNGQLTAETPKDKIASTLFTEEPPPKREGVYLGGGVFVETPKDMMKDLELCKEQERKRKETLRIQELEARQAMDDLCGKGYCDSFNKSITLHDFNHLMNRLEYFKNPKVTFSFETLDMVQEMFENNRKIASELLTMLNKY